MSRSAAASDAPFVARQAPIDPEIDRKRAERERIAAGRRAAFEELSASPLASAAFLVRAWAGIFAVEASLRVLGYRRTLGWIERVPVKRGAAARAATGLRPPAAATRTSVHLGERLVRKAYRAHVLPGGCLPRSLVQYLLHRRDGTSARLVVGVRRPDPAAPAGAAASTFGSSPFPADRGAARPRDRGRANERPTPGIEAHAWVESDATTPFGAEPFAPIFSSGDSR